MIQTIKYSHDNECKTLTKLNLCLNKTLLNFS